MNLTGRPVQPKPPKPEKNPAHMAKVAQMPCVICWECGMPQLSPTQVHHCIHGRFSQSKRPDTMTIPLCEGHHLGDFDRSKIALHRQPQLWISEYGEDVEWLSWVEAEFCRIAKQHADQFVSRILGAELSR